MQWVICYFLSLPLISQLPPSFLFCFTSVNSNYMTSLRIPFYWHSHQALEMQKFGNPWKSCSILPLSSALRNGSIGSSQWPVAYLFSRAAASWLNPASPEPGSPVNGRQINSTITTATVAWDSVNSFCLHQFQVCTVRSQSIDNCLWLSSEPPLSLKCGMDIFLTAFLHLARSYASFLPDISFLLRSPSLCSSSPFASVFLSFCPAPPSPTLQQMLLSHISIWSSVCLTFYSFWVALCLVVHQLSVTYDMTSQS